MTDAKRFALLIFDWDGTLADSVGQIVATMQAAISTLGLPPRADTQIAELIGLGLVDAMTRLYPEFVTPNLLSLLTAYRSRVPANAYTAPLFPQVLETLSAFHAQGYLLAVATGKNRLGLDRSFSQHPALADLFHLSRCADETADKPDPKMLLEILAQTGIAPERALMIGDTEYDVQMAMAIGMPALGVGSGVHEPGRLLKAGAVAVVDGVQAMPDWLQSHRLA